MLTLENLQNQLIPRNDNYETLFNSFRNDIRTMVFNQLNANQREMLQRIIRIQQPKRMSITQRRTLNFRILETQRLPRQITSTIMTDLEIHSQSGSSVGRAEYNPENSGSITFVTENNLGTHDLSDDNDEERNPRRIRFRSHENNEGLTIDNQINLAINKPINRNIE
ncbi:15957_t:CDS:1 [Cetraspora pellucida]|uniref:15957_t:CDS:1 n=1 Tax=Cetraspora pellucida TaxID=1433469 RepID=A0ACA9R2Y5_9GLOM|nr:15957_t:CDS:1 [Cetraspora pellucida]